MDEEKFWDLLSLKLSGEATGEELAALDNLLQKKPEFGLQAQLMAELWKKRSGKDNNTDDFFNRHLQRLSNQPDFYTAVPEPPVPLTETLPIRRTQRWLLPLTGIAALLVVLFLIFKPLKPAPAGQNTARIAQNTVSTGKGSKSAVELPDGSKAWLNADSKLTYNENFTGELREVSLEGEAYFDVVKDKTRPFIIHTSTIDIKVLGTAFNVRAYQSEKNTETALFRGSVEVTLHNNPEKKIVLKPNEKLKVNNKSLQFNNSNAAKDNTVARNTALNITVSKIHVQAKDSAALETLWMKNKLVFDAESLEEVAGKIERWYNVKVIIKGDENLRRTAYSAIFENERLPEIMEALKITGNFKYTITRDTVTIQ